MNSHAKIQMQDVSVHYRHERNRATTMKELAIRLLHRDLDTELTRALEGVSAEIVSGEVFCVVGQNGAGKSTLLKVLSGIVRPTTGRVRVWGKVAPLLSVGAGFHTDLTGRENIYLYGTILGRRRAQITATLDGIVDFAELADFVDSPLRTYSSGMVARLGFAVAMASRPDILLVDEVLAVGDTRFREKCRRRFMEFVAEGTTIVLVTHAVGEVLELSSRALWLEKGTSRALGDSDQVVRAYQTFLASRGEKTTIRS
jgi:ABC-type polysaccharide/polyol phosphate transport system ATPase subunit